jgi:hypothetical protein
MTTKIAMTFYSFYQRPTPSTSEQYSISNLEGEYAGLKWVKDREYALFYLVPIDGKEIPASLACKYTSPKLLFDAIDHWMAKNQAQLSFPDAKKKK